MKLSIEEHINTYQIAERDPFLKKDLGNFSFGDLCRDVINGAFAGLSLPNGANLLPELFENLGTDAVKDAMQASIERAMRGEDPAAPSSAVVSTPGAAQSSLSANPAYSSAA